MSKPRIWLLFLLTFAAGLLAGAAGMRAYQRNNVRQFMHSDWERQHEYFLHRLNREINLTPEQQTQVRAILGRMRDEFAKLRQSTQPESRRILKENRQRIEKVLTPEQAAQFGRFMDRWTSARTRRSEGGAPREEHSSHRRHGPEGAKHPAPPPAAPAPSTTTSAPPPAASAP